MPALLVSLAVRISSCAGRAMRQARVNQRDFAGFRQALLLRLRLLKPLRVAVYLHRQFDTHRALVDNDDGFPLSQAAVFGFYENHL